MPVHDLTRNELDRAGEARLYRALRHFWQPVMLAADLSDRPQRAELLGEQLVLVRMAGEIRCFADRCAHRGTALSLGWLEDDQIRCPYHGWTYGPDGSCTAIPGRFGTVVPGRALLHSYLADERYGIIWVCLMPEPALPLP